VADRRAAVRQINDAAFEPGPVPASHYNLVSQWDGVPDDAFMVVVFEREALPEKGGVARYHPEFDEAI
jgi:predicted N-acetyltransferase YhbS